MSVYYLRDRWLRGPITHEELRSLMDAGVLDGKAPVWVPDQEDWASPPNILIASGSTKELAAGAPRDESEPEAAVEPDWSSLPSPRNLMALRLAKEQELITEVQTERILDELFRSPSPDYDLLSSLERRGWITQGQRTTLEYALDRDSKPKLLSGYEILKELGSGGMGTTYLARQISLDRLVALKVLLPKYSQDEQYIRRFEREAKMAALLNHENIAAAYDVGQFAGQHFISMEYVQGSTVRELLHQEGQLSEERAKEIVVQVCRALAHAHEHDLVHRDVKPENIIVRPNGRAKLIDMGLAKSTAADRTDLTSTGLIVCTPDYASPEQGRAEKDIDIRSDVYSLGCVFYEMLAGEPPFSGSTAIDVVNKHINAPFPSLRERRSDVGDRVCRVIEKMATKRQQDRYQTPAEVIESLSPGAGPPRLSVGSTAGVAPVAEQLKTWEKEAATEVLLLSDWREYVHLVALKLDERLEEAKADPEFRGYVQTIFGELVSNAFDHGCKDVAEGVVRIRMELNEAFFSIEVEDPGPGFPVEETLEQIKEEPPGRHRRRGLIQVQSIADVTYSAEGSRVKAVLYRKREGSGIFAEEREGISYVEIRGKGDLALEDSFKRWVKNYNVRTPKLICLMVRTEYVSSRFVGTVVEFNERLAEAGSALTVWVEHQSCYRNMQSLGLSAVVGAFDSLADAELALRYPEKKPDGRPGPVPEYVFVDSSEGEATAPLPSLTPGYPKPTAKRIIVILLGFLLLLLATAYLMTTLVMKPGAAPLGEEVEDEPTRDLR